MAKNSVLDWDTTAANNTDIGGININEGCPAANINNGMRETMAQIKAGVDYKAVQSSKSANYTAVLNDNNAIIRFSAAATLTLTAAATLAANWHITVVANGGDVVIDPNASETIDGKTTLTVRDGSSVLVWCDGTNFRTNLGADQRVPKGHINGLTLSNNGTDATNDINIATGECASNETIPHLITLTSALIKRLDANWAAGTNQGMRYSGAAIANGTYHIFAADAGNGASCDVYAYPDPGGIDANSASFAATVLAALQGETGGSAYVRVRRIGSIVRESGSIVTFQQCGDIFLRSDVVDHNSTAAFASNTLTLSVPNGIVVRPIFVAKIFGNGSANAAVAFGPHARGSASFFVQSCGPNTVDRTTLDQFATNTSRQIYMQVSIAAGALTEFTVTTNGWIDDRGRLS